MLVLDSQRSLLVVVVVSRLLVGGQSPDGPGAEGDPQYRQTNDKKEKRSKNLRKKTTQPSSTLAYGIEGEVHKLGFSDRLIAAAAARLVVIPSNHFEREETISTGPSVGEPAAATLNAM